MSLFVCAVSAHAADSCSVSATPGTRPVTTSAATSVADYRIDAARHIYEAYASCVLHGKLPPTIQAVALIELAVSKDGLLRDVRFVRVPPEMPNAIGLLDGMLRSISPFPSAPDAGVEEVRFNEVWMFDENGRFQLGALTEGPQ